MTEMSVIKCLLLLVSYLVVASCNSHALDNEPKARNKRQTSGKPMSGVELRITTILERPYTHSKDDGATFYGYIPDVIDKLKEHLGFTYNMTLSPDGRYGMADEDGNWNGMIGELIKNERDNTTGVHLAAAPLTITRAREHVVDFLNPFAHVGLTAVIQKPVKSSGSWHFHFNVFKPLSAECWIIITVVMIVVWIFFSLMNCFNPYEYGERYKRHLATEEQSQLFTVMGSLWFTFTTLQWQGYDRAPRSVASKVMGCFWMIFVTLTIITYISSFLNYMWWASLVHNNKQSSEAAVELDLADLIEQKDGYTYGCVRDGSTYTYFTEVSLNPAYQRMAQHWTSEEGEDDLVDNMAEALERMRNQKYAFIGETMSIKHLVGENCDLVTLDFMVGRRSYGLAIPNNFPYEEEMRKTILNLIESGEIDALEEKWFETGKCHEKKPSARESYSKSNFDVHRPQPVTLDMFWSPLVLITVGILFSLALGTAEILYYKYRGRYERSNRHPGTQLTNEDDGHI